MSAPALEALLVLQAVDTDLDRHRHRRATLPEKKTLADLAGRVRMLDAQLADAQVPFAAVMTREESLERDLATTEERIATVNRRLYSGEVAASRDLQAMTTEVKALQQRQSDLEDQVLAVLEEREPLEGSLAKLTAERSESLRGIDELTEQISDLEATIDLELAELVARRDAVVLDVPAELVSTYERIRARLGGVGAARLVGAQCQGCFLTLPAGEVDRLKYLPDDAIVTCEDCGRILVRS